MHAVPRNLFHEHDLRLGLGVQNGQLVHPLVVLLQLLDQLLGLFEAPLGVLTMQNAPLWEEN